MPVSWRWLQLDGRLVLAVANESIAGSQLIAALAMTALNFQPTTERNHVEMLIRMGRQRGLQHNHDGCRGGTAFVYARPSDGNGVRS